jgi:hypothetical protein
MSSGGSVGRGGSATTSNGGPANSSAGTHGGATTTPQGGASTVNDGGAANDAGEAGSSGEAGASNAGEGGAPAMAGSSAGGGDAGHTAASGASGTGGSTGIGGSSGGTTGSAGSGGTAGSSGGATGGSTGSGGARGGAGGQAGTGGYVDDGGFGGVTDGSSLPLVELLVDGSSTMFEDGAWSQVFASLVTDGVLAHFEGSLNLGLTVYQGSTTTSTSESDPSCAALSNVGFAGDNGGEVGKLIADVGNAYVVGTKYETPTDFALLAAINRLNAVSVGPSVKKYIVLVIDGEPNTCRVKDPQCGQDAAIAMAQEARASGIRTLVVGLGTILGATDDGCAPSLSRCHADHLQDLANAGVGNPVEPPPKYSYVQSCVQQNGGALVASYTSPGGGASAHYYVSTATDGLTGEFNQAFQAIVDGTVP